MESISISYKPGEVRNSESYKAIKNMLDGPGSTQNAIDQFIGPMTESSHRPDNTDFTKAWNSVIVVAAETPHHAQGRLVDFVCTLCTRLDDSVDIEVFGSELREAWNVGKFRIEFHVMHTLRLTPTVGDDVDVNVWLNLNAFSARLTATAQPSLDFSLFGIWTLRAALEGSQISSSVAWIGAAACWPLYAGETVYRMCSNKKNFGGKMAKPGDGFNDEPWRGYSTERWQAWRERLGDAADEAEGEARGLVQSALELLPRIEQSQ